MLQARRQLDLGQKPIGAERLGDSGADDLDGDLPRVPNVVREVDGRHPAFAELALDVVAARETAPEHVVGLGHALRLRLGEEGARAFAAGPRWRMPGTGRTWSRRYTSSWIVSGLNDGVRPGCARRSDAQ